MPTPAERIYEAAAGKLADQQNRLGRFTNAVAPLGAIATAGALLLKPATNGIAYAPWPQIIGLAIGGIGLLLMLLEGYRLLYGVKIEGVLPEILLPIAKADGRSAESDPFHLKATVDLDKVWQKNQLDVRRCELWFNGLVVGLLLELLGLGAAALIQTNWTHQTAPGPVGASLHLTEGHLSPREMSLAGELAASAKGRVRVAVSLLGPTGEAISLHPSIHDGRFRTGVRVTGDFVPLRSASYSITWAGSSSVAGANLTGTIARCPGDCQ